jgi:hypothetical protein
MADSKSATPSIPPSARWPGASSPTFRPRRNRPPAIWRRGGGGIAPPHRVPAARHPLARRPVVAGAASRATGRAMLRRPVIAGLLNGSSAALRVAAKRPGTDDKESRRGAETASGGISLLCCRCGSPLSISQNWRYLIFSLNMREKGRSLDSYGKALEVAGGGEEST